VILYTTGGDLIEALSSSFDLSLFSLKAGSHHDKNAGATTGGRGASSVSIGELWPGMYSVLTFPCGLPGFGKNRRSYLACWQRAVEDPVHHLFHQGVVVGAPLKTRLHIF
jgi:hypothetical protein